VLTTAGLPVTKSHDHLVVAAVGDPAWITEQLGQRGMWVSELTPLTPDLESVFLQLTGTTPDPGAPKQVDDAIRPDPKPVGDPIQPGTIDLGEHS
jgi:ABC-2 type transport system ATP-binding protein